MAGYKELFEQYKGKEAAVKAGTRELEAAKEQVSGLEKQLREHVKAADALKPEIEEALAAEIRDRRTDLAKAKQALAKGDFEEAGKLIRHERPEKSVPNRLVYSFKTSSYSADILRKLEYLDYKDGSRLVKRGRYECVPESALAAVILAGSNKMEEAAKLMKGIELHTKQNNDGFYIDGWHGSYNTYNTAAVAFAYAAMGEYGKAKKLANLLEEKNMGKKGLVKHCNTCANADTTTNALLAATYAVLRIKTKCDEYLAAIETAIGYQTTGGFKFMKADTNGNYANQSANAALSVAYRCAGEHEKAAELMKGVYDELSAARGLDTDELLAISDMMRK